MTSLIKIRALLKKAEMDEVVGVGGNPNGGVVLRKGYNASLDAIAQAQRQSATPLEALLGVKKVVVEKKNYWGEGNHYRKVEGVRIPGAKWSFSAPPGGSTNHTWRALSESQAAQLEKLLKDS